MLNQRIKHKKLRGHSSDMLRCQTRRRGITGATESQDALDLVTFGKQWRLKGLPIGGTDSHTKDWHTYLTSFLPHVVE